MRTEDLFFRVFRGFGESFRLEAWRLSQGACVCLSKCWTGSVVGFRLFQRAHSGLGRRNSGVALLGVSLSLSVFVCVDFLVELKLLAARSDPRIIDFQLPIAEEQVRSLRVGDEGSLAASSFIRRDLRDLVESICTKAANFLLR